MSLFIECDTGDLTFDDIIRLVSAIDDAGNIYLRTYDDGTASDDLTPLACVDGFGYLDILRGALVLNDDGEYALNVSFAGFCATYQTIYDSFTTPPSDAIAAAQNTMVRGLIADGVWAKLDILHMYAQTTNAAGEALVNWVNPGTFDATAVHAPAFVALEGFTGDGTNDYIDCNWNPSTNGINYVLDSATVGGYNRTNTNVGTEGGSISGSRIYLWTRSAATLYLMLNQNAGGIGTANADSRGMYINSRTASNVIKAYKNKVAIINDTTVSTTIPNLNIYSLGINSTGALYEPTTKQVSLFFAGSGFVQGDVDNMTDRFETYMDSNGKGVIP